MPKTLYLATDGRELKNITLPQYPDDAWEWITGAPDTKDDHLYARVAAVYRVANMNADAVANMPFAILNKRGDEVDASDDWQNKVGFLPNPRELFRLWRLSLFMTNTAYGFMEGNRVIQSLRYLVPDTITPVVDKWEGLQGFNRKIGTEERYYPVEERRIFYMWKLDHTTELLPSEHSEFRALMAAAGVLFYIDHFTQSFFQRGGIKPSLLNVKGVPTKDDREKIEHWWDRLIRGVTETLGKVVVADTMEVQTIGEGVDNLRDSSIHREKIEDIAIAAGMPLSLLLANSANYATADIEYRTWFRNKIIPDVHFFEDVMNEQLFRQMGYHIEFRPEITNTGTEEERERAGAYRAYVLSGMKRSIAAQLVGLDMPPDVEYEALDEGLHPLETRMAKAGASASEGIIAEDEVEADVEGASEKAIAEAPTLLTIDQLRELELWQSFAYRKLKRNEPLDFPFVCKSLPESVASAIREQLPVCRTRADVERVFQMSARDEDPIKELAEALNLAVSKMEVV
jgi:phage portal protein BeeE